MLEPLSLSHATGMVDVLADTDVYSFTEGEPPSIDELCARYQAQIEGPAGGDEQWLNWIVVQRTNGQLVRFVQATITAESADIAWLIAVARQGRGFATEAARAMFDSLVNEGVKTLTAHIHPDHTHPNASPRRSGWRHRT